MSRLVLIVLTVLVVALAVVGFDDYRRSQQIQRIELARDAKYQSYAATMDRSARFIADQSARSTADNTTIGLLLSKLATAAGIEQDVRSMADAAERRAAAANAERDTALANIQTLRRNLYATDPDSGAWARLGVPVPVGDQLRQQWEQAAQRGVRPPDH